MLAKPMPNNDLLALGAKLKGSSNSTGNSVKASSSLGHGALGSLEGGLKNDEFLKLLQTQASMAEISPEKLVSFFKKNSEVATTADIDKLFAKLEGAQGRALLKELHFDGKNFKMADGSNLEIENLSEKLESVGKKVLLEASEQKVPKAAKVSSKNLAAQDYLSQKDQLSLGKREVNSENNQRATLKNNVSAVHQYRRETNSINSNMIRPMGSDQPQITPALNQAGKLNSSATKINNQLDSINDGEMSSANTSTMDIGDHRLMHLRQDSASLGSQSEAEGNLANIETIDLSNIKASNKAELMQKVSQYIESSYVSSKEQVDLMVKHDELGAFRIQVNKSGKGGAVDVEINSMTSEAQKFFADNEVELIKNLSKSGIKISDLRVIHSKESIQFASLKSDAGKNSNSDTQNSGDNRSFSQSQNFGENPSGQRGEGNHKRKSLWDQAKEFRDNLYS